MKPSSSGLSPREVSLLVSIRDGKRTGKEISQNLGVSSPELTRMVKSLTSKGLVVSERLGMSTSVSISRLKHSTHLRRVLSEYSHMRLERILSLSTLDVLSCLAASPGQTRADILSTTGISPRTLQTVLKRLRGCGIVRVKTRGVYELSDRFAPFGEFAQEFDEYSNQRNATQFCTDSIMIWHRGREFIIRTKCEKEDADFKLTAFSVFERFGVPLFLGWQYYYHPVGKWRGTVDEALLQSLLTRPRDTSENTAILMLWEKNGLSRALNRVKKGATRYGLEDDIETIAAYFRDPERNPPPDFPKIGELKEKLRSDGS